ncbi:MAG: hypothetical protein DRP60_00425 [Spirochaetes bacterium]|nr:MAG: hypothetical protein DRP60_00425 [Spirochaetota bacterium]
MNQLSAGSAELSITPVDSQFLFGYPHVERFSTGVMNPLLSSSLYLNNGNNDIMFVANDIIFVDKASTKRARKRISESTGIREDAIMISATHTHSGPITVDYLSNSNDPIVPKTDLAYLQLMEDGIVESGINAFKNSRPAEAGLSVADGSGVGTNRRDPSGPADPQVPVLMVRDTESGEFIACMLVYSMHPTVLHEDSTLVSGDFPSFTRDYLKKKILGTRCPVLYHTGPEGNQSPRHVTSSNTFSEAKRLGEMLGARVEAALENIEYTSSLYLGSEQGFIMPSPKKIVSLAFAKQHLEKAVRRLESLRKDEAPSQEVRTAECDWFGAEETVTLAEASSAGNLNKYIQSCLPAEIQVFKIGDWLFAAWPGEVFIEFSLSIKSKYKNLFVINLANGEFQGYIVTPEAEVEGGYEASNAMFGSETGDMLIKETSRILKQMGL